jgi:hypothetical protein
MSWVDRLLVLVVGCVCLSVVLAAISTEVMVAAVVVALCAIAIRVVWWWTGRW